jgi:hypothetical protein
MKKLLSVISLFLIGCFLSSCPNRTTTWITIKSARIELFSFDQNGIWPYLASFDRNELGISVYADSLAERVEFAQSISFGKQLYAMENPNQIIETNSIDSLNFITIFDFDSNHPAGSNINDILLQLDYMGKTKEVEISSLSAFDHHFKFAMVPQNDSLQFEVTGIITEVGKFELQTVLVILD